MIPEIGQFALILALMLALTQAPLPLIGAARGAPQLIALARPTAQAQFIFVTIAFSCLAYSFITNDFSVLNVATNSNSQLPLQYRLAATWGSHEGSLLLWTFFLTLWMVAVTLFSNHLPREMVARVLGVMATISVGFLLFMLLTSNPFERLFPVPADGRDLNPLLQDPAMVAHPPMLYMGYVGFSVAFAFAVSALIGGRLDATWARWSRPWTTVAWMFLTCGIALGSFWAYYELGWGGWWFWDPVENASFMPWLVGTALIHSLAVTEKRGGFKSWTVLLAIGAFSLSLVGTFLVRSGVLTSVHAFANDPKRGTFILGFLTLVIGGSLALYAWRAPLLKQGGLFAPISREGALILNNLFLTTACATVFVGTLYPLALEALTGEKISVGAPFFNATFVPLFIPLLVAMSFGPLLAWKRSDLYGVAQRLLGALAVAVIGIAATFAAENGGPVVAPFGVGLALFVMTGALTDLMERTGLFRSSFGTVVRRAGGLPRSAWGTMIAHFGVGLTVLGIVGETQWGAERIASMRPGESLSIRHYDLGFDEVVPRPGPNFREFVGKFTVRRGGEVIGIM